MKQETRYRYEKRIKEMGKELSVAREYRQLAMIIFQAVQENADSVNSISKKWLLAQFRGFLK